MLDDITNAEFDIEAALVPASVGGPLTRVGDLDSDPVISPNSQIRIETIAASLATVMISYDEMLIDVVRNDIVLKAHGQQGTLQQVFELIAALDVFNDHTAFDPLTVADDGYMAFIRLLQANILPIMNSLPLEKWFETPPNVPLAAAFTEVFADPLQTVTNTSDINAVSAWLWDWGNGFFSTDWDPAAYTYPVAGTFTTRLILVGPDGVSVASGAANVVA